MTILSKLTEWYFTKNAMPYWCILLLDSAIFLGSCLLVYDLSQGTLYTLTNFWNLLGLYSLYLIVYCVYFRIFHTYSGVIRYSSFNDLYRLGGAMFSGAITVYLIRRITNLDHLIDLNYMYGGRILLFASLLATILMWTVRIAVKYIYENFFDMEKAPLAVVYGTKVGGVSLAKSIANQKPAKYRLEGFLSDNPRMKGKFVMGKKVMVADSYSVERMKKQGIKVLLVSPLKSKALRDNKSLVDQLISAGIHIMMLPSSFEWDGKSDISAQTLKDVDVEDLLPRDEIQVDMEAIGELLKDKCIMITGAAGSIGSEMVRQISIFQPKRLLLIDQAETPMHDIRLMMHNRWPQIEALTIVTSITKSRQIESIFSKYRPDYVFHAAAYKHVPMMEDNPANAVQNNCYGTRVIADLAVKYGTKKFVMISTDKAVNPTNVMGCSKRICEIYCQSLNRAIQNGKVEGVTQFVTTRFGNVLGSNGSVIPIFREQIKKGGPLTVTHPDIIRYFMLIPEACKLVLEAGTMGNGGEIFVFDMGNPVRIADLAQRMIDLSGAHDVKIKFTGLRDGEKLYEEVLNNAEQTRPTPHPKIKVASVREYDYAVAKQQEEELYSLSYTYDDMAIVKKMKEIVPEYKSKHSKYEVLD